MNNFYGFIKILDMNHQSNFVQEACGYLYLFPVLWHYLVTFLLSLMILFFLLQFWRILARSQQHELRMPFLLAFLPIQHVQKLFRLATNVFSIFGPAHICRGTLVWPAGRRILIDGVDGDGRLEQFGVLLEIHPELMSYDIILKMDEFIERFVVVCQKPRSINFRIYVKAEDS